MEKIKVCYDSHGNTLNVWFDDPKKEHVCEETGEEVDEATVESRRKLSEAGFALLLKEPKADHHSKRFVVARLIRRVGLIGIVLYTLLHFTPSNLPSGEMVELDPAEMQLRMPSYDSTNTASGTVVIWDSAENPWTTRVTENFSYPLYAER